MTSSEKRFHLVEGHEFLAKNAPRFRPSWILGLRWEIGNNLRALRYKISEIRGRLPLEHGWRWIFGIIMLRRRDNDVNSTDCYYYENKNVRRKLIKGNCGGDGHAACRFCKHYNPASPHDSETEDQTPESYW